MPRRKSTRRFNNARAAYRLQQRKSRAIGYPLNPYSELVEKYLRKPPTLNNLWNFEQELKNRTINKQEKERASATRSEYIARFLLGKSDSQFLLKMYETDYKLMGTFIERELKKISKNKKCSQKQAVQILSDYVKRLQKKMAERQTIMMQPSLSLEAQAAEPRKAAELRHDFFAQVLQTFKI
jgi:hypothetical protein